MFINFYSVLTVSNLSNMLKCVLLLPSDCVCVHYCNEIISIINKIILQSGGESSIAWWRNVLAANRPGSETSKGRNVQRAKRLEAKRPGGELTKEQNVQLPSDRVPVLELNLFLFKKPLLIQSACKMGSAWKPQITANQLQINRKSPQISIMQSCRKTANHHKSPQT